VKFSEQPARVPKQAGGLLIMEPIAVRLDQILEKRGYRRSLIDEDANVTLRLGEHQRSLHCLDRSRSFMLYLEGQRS
jgi:hypothetical protein